MLDADDNPKIGGFGLTETLTPELSRDESLRDYRESEQHLRLPVRCGDRYDMPYPLSSPSKTKTEHSLTCIMQSKHTHTHTHTHTSLISLTQLFPNCHMTSTFKSHPLFPVAPYRWCAPEVLGRTCFSTASDAWSFGVVCIEVFTAGTPPYGAWPESKVVAQVMNGYATSTPFLCARDSLEEVSGCIGTDI